MADRELSYSSVKTAPSPATSGTSLVLQSGYGANMPVPPFDAMIWSPWPALHAGWAPPASAPWARIPLDCEIVTVTAIATDTLTITRAVRGSTARTVVAGDQFMVTRVVIPSAQFATADTFTNSTVAEQTFATQYTIAANKFVANKLYRVTGIVQFTSGSSPVTEVWKLKLGSTIVYASPAGSPAASFTTRGGGITWYLQGTAAAGASVSVECGSVAQSILPATFNSNTIAQGVLVATNAAQVLSISVTFGGTGSLDSVSLRQLICEELT